VTVLKQCTLLISIITHSSFFYCTFFIPQNGLRGVVDQDGDGGPPGADFALRLAAEISQERGGDRRLASAPSIVDIRSSPASPAAPGGTIVLSADCAAGSGGPLKTYKMAGIGNNAGNKAFNTVFSSGDRDGSIARITADQFNALSPAQLRDAYDILLFTWATSPSLNAHWATRIKPYIDLGGHVFWEDDRNIGDLAPEVDGVQSDGSFGSTYVITPQVAPNEVLTSNGITGTFSNHHLKLSTVDPSWTVYISSPASSGSFPLAIFKVFPSGGRMIVQGPDQDYHASRGNNQYQLILNQLDWLTASLGTTISWSSAAGVLLGEGPSLEIVDSTYADAGAYTAVCTDDNGLTDTATVTIAFSAEPQTFTIVGTDAAVGEIDPHSEGSTVSANGPWGPTYSLGPGHPWQNNNGGAIAPSWINVYPSFFEGLNTVSWVRIRFTMPEDISNASFNLKMKNDNIGDVALNGNFLATIAGYGEEMFEVGSAQASWLQAGENVITMTLTDTGGWVGYQYLIQLNFDATEGADLIAAGSPAPSAASPSAGPSAIPSASPSAVPSSAPSSSPSSSPSTEPSASPSTSPSSQPSTSPSSAPSFESVSHDVCENFAVHARTTVTFDGVSSTVHHGDVGVSPGTSVTGAMTFDNGGNSTGLFELDQGELVLESSTFAASVLVAHEGMMDSSSVAMEIEMGGLTFTPGTYRSDSAINFAHGTVVTLDGNNEPNPVFLFIAGSTLVTAADTKFNLIHGAKAENVLWALGTAATLGARSVVEGSILAGTAITFGTQSRLNGCALAQSAVTFESEGSVELNHYEADGTGNALNGNLRG
jgi:hypothetical protein